MLVTYSPGYYVDCLRELAKHCEGGKSMTAEEQAQIVRGWATVVVGKSGKESEGDAMETDEDDETEAGERLGPRYTGLRCMA